MAKSDCKIEDIELEPAYSQQTVPKFSDGKQVNAFDTETFNGDVFMLSYSLDTDFSGVIDTNGIDELSARDIFDKITHRDCRSAINVWYNLDFDVNAILSGLLEQRELAQLAITNNVTTAIDGMQYELSYVKGKFLNITDEHSNQYDHFDISQFFYTSLDNAAEEWLGENKVDEIDTSKFSSKSCNVHAEVDYNCSDCWKDSDAKNYILDNYSTIREYAEKDALLTQRLGRQLVKEAENLQIPMGKPYSTGFISAEFQRANTEEKPKFGKRKYQSFFWDSYYGGRFEVFERGKVGEIVAPDINSAYPAVMRNLPDPTTLTWIFKSNEFKNDDFADEPEPFNIEDLKDADFGVVDVTVTTDSNAKIQPFAYKMNGQVKYPVMENTRITVLKPIFEFALKHGLVTSYTLHDCWLGYEIEETEYPFTWIDELYADRKEMAKKGKEKKELLIKIILNSAYGKTCQTTERKKMIQVGNGEEYICDENEKIYPSVFLSTTQRNHLSDEDVVISSQKCGRRFNPFIAAHITGLTRLELHKSVVEYGLVDDTYMFATDCIMVDKNAYEKSDFSELIETPNYDLENDEFRQSAIDSLGGWDFDYEGTAFIVGSGVYEVEFPDCQKDCVTCNDPAHSRKTKTRGFTEKSLSTSLKELAHKHPNGVPIANERPLTIPEVLISPIDKQTGEKRKVSEFVKNTKELNPNFDTKRNWSVSDVDFHDLLNNQYDSKPLILHDELVGRYGNHTPTTKEAEKRIEGLLYGD